MSDALGLVWLVLTCTAGFGVLRALVPRRASTVAPAAGPTPRVSIIVPARDEEANLPTLLASLAALDPPAHEVIVVDDHSCDRTAAIAAAAGARVVAAPPLPEGWRGKCWACHTGAAAATGDVLLFTDADTAHGRDSLARATAALAAERADLITAVPTHVAIAPWEKLQAVFHLLLLVATGGVRHHAIGQYLLFRRPAYERLGGHAGVREQLAEDLALAARLEAVGGRRRVLIGPGLVRVRMYPEGFLAFCRGWLRNFRSGVRTAGARGALAVTLVIGWLLGAPIAVVTADSAARLAIGVVATFGAVVAIARRQRLLGDFGAASALAYPVFVLVFVGVSIAAALAALARRPITWRGRRYPVTTGRSPGRRTGSRRSPDRAGRTGTAGPP